MDQSGSGGPRAAIARPVKGQNLVLGRVWRDLKESDILGVIRRSGAHGGKLLEEVMDGGVGGDL